MKTSPFAPPSHASLLTTLAVAMTVAGCGDATGFNGGRIVFTLSAGDGPSSAPAASAPATAARDSDDDDDRDDDDRRPFFQSANVIFSSILVRNGDGQLINADVTLPVTVDIVAMEEEGRVITLPDGLLPAGTYDQVVVVITAVQGVLDDDSVLTIEPPGGGWTAVVPVCPFDVEDGSTETVGLVLPVRSALSWRHGHFRFLPRFHSRLQCGAPEEEPGGGEDG